MVGRLSGWVGYTLSWTELQFDSVNACRKYYAKYDRRHDVSIVGIYKLSKNLTISATWVYGSGNAITLPQSIVPVNMIFSYGRALIPRVYFAAPRVVVTALHPDFVHHAAVVEAIDNLLINQSHVKQSIKSAALDAYL